jgi:hypothetical protein
VLVVRADPNGKSDPFLAGRIGRNTSKQIAKMIGPTTLSHFFAWRVKTGILNNPKSAPEKYGANRRIKEKLSNTAPNGSGRPNNLKRLVLIIFLFLG